jgi:HAE1 family hydrophobic/amphiphilic exporter-1
MKYFLENRMSAYMLFIGFLIFGIIGLTRLPLSLMPQINYPALSVIIEYPGISPDKIETIITRPVEQIIRTVPGIESIQSISEEGKARMNITFHLDTDIRVAALKIREKIGLIRGMFPRAVQEPVVLRYDPSDRPVIIASVESIPDKNASPVIIREYIERNIKPRLQRIDGISEVNVVGGLQREIHIDLNSGSFSARAMEFNRIFTTLQESNVTLPGGIALMGGKEYFVHTPERYRNLHDISATMLFSHETGRFIRLDDIAQVTDSFREREDIARHNGSERVMIYVNKAGDANVLEVCNAAKMVISESSGSDIRLIYNQGDYIESAITNVIKSGLWGLAIVILTVYLFYRSFSRAAIIGISIPMSVITVFACMYFAGVPIDVISLSGLALSAGMVVDNSIIVTETFPSSGLTPELAFNGINKVKNAITASTATTIAVFFPIVFGDTMTRRMYAGMAFTVISALIVSLAVALILVPTLQIDISGRKGKFIPYGAKGISALTEKISSILHIRWSQITDSIVTIENKALVWYESALDYTFLHKKKIAFSLGILTLLSAVSLLFVRSEFIDPFSSGEFYVYCEFPTGTTLLATDSAVKLAEGHLTKMKIAEKISTKTEKWRGTIAVTLKESLSDSEERSAIKKKISQDLNKILSPLHGFAFISEADEAAARELSISFIGESNDVLREIARTAAGKIQALPGIEECVLRFREGKPAYWLMIDRDKAGMSNITSYELADFFHNSMFGPVITKFVDKDKEVDVRVKFAKDPLLTLDTILAYPIPTSGGVSIPASEVMTVKEEIDPTKIWRLNGRRSVTITARIGALSFSEAASRIEKALTRIAMPLEYTWEFDDTIDKIKKTRMTMILLTGLSILLVFMIIAGLLESLTLPLVIMVTVPLAHMGVFITFFLTNSTLNVAAYIGLIVLTGTAVNNGIVLVDRINNTLNTFHVITNSKLIYEIRKISLEHFRPVAITSITTVVGFIPALLSGGAGSNLWRPLALTVIAGLSFSSILTLVIIPLVFYFMYSISHKEILQ